MPKNEPFYYNIPIMNKDFHDLNPVDAGFMQCEPNHTSPASMHPSFLIHYIVSGKGTFTIEDGTVYHLHAGQCFVIVPYKTYKYVADSEDPWFYIWIGFNGALASNLLGVKRVHDFSAPELFYNIRNAINIHHYREEWLYAQLLLIYRELAPPETQGNYYVNIIRHQICSSYMMHITVESLANYCGINKSYATRLFKKETGLSINQFIIYYRMHKAAEILQLGYSVEDTARLVGYEEYHSFTKKFKEHYGVPPSKYKSFSHLSSGEKIPKNYTPPPGINPFMKK